MKITTSYNPTRISFRSLDVGDCFYWDNDKDIFMKIKKITHKNGNMHEITDVNAIWLNKGNTFLFGDNALVVPVECELVVKIK